MKIGLGVLTYNRPEYFKQCLEGIDKHLNKVVDVLEVYEDKSDDKYREEYDKIYQTSPHHLGLTIPDKHTYIAIGKNHLLKSLMEKGCDWLFLVEEDVVPQSEKAVTGYLEAAKLSGIEHLNFHAHGPLNVTPVLQGEVITLWPNLVGAWSMYSRKCIETVGYMDEKFVNAIEHVEHTQRIVMAGLSTPMYQFADATGSEEWIKEIPGSLNTSTIRNDPHNQERYLEAVKYWQEKYD